MEGELAFRFEFFEFLDVFGFGSGKVFFAVGEVYGGSFFCEGDGGFHGGVSTADDEDAFAAEF